MVLRATMWVPKTPTELWPFFSDAHNLELLTPPFLHFQVLTPVPIAMQVGTRIDYRLRLRGIPIRWRTHIARWEPPFCFADEQERGPYRRWVHTHTFQARDRGTEIGDQVEFEVRGGPLAPLVSRWFVEPDVRRVFDYRAQQIAKRFGGDATGARLEMKAPATA
jgi:ligand-binding SRPBCC domain-containing protein